MNAALKDTQGIKRGDIEAVGQVSNLPAEVEQRGTDREPGSLYLQGVDEGYSQGVGYGFQTTAKGYGSAREVWETLQTEKDTAVISSDLADRKSVVAGKSVDLGG